MSQNARQANPTTMCENKISTADYLKLRRFLSKKVGNLADAEDLAQETLIKMMEVENSGTIVHYPKAFMFRVASNLAYDMLRHNMRTSRIFEDRNEASLQEIPHDTVSGALNPEILCQNRELSERIFGLINTLPPKCQNAFQLTKIEGRTYPEAASEMKLSISTIEKYLSRALNLIKTHPEFRETMMV
jgi:RNA polymerase sigma-70 factor (ECF subfamily)